MPVSHVHQVTAKVEIHHKRERQTDIEAAKNMKEKRQKFKTKKRFTLKSMLCCMIPQSTDDEKDNQVEKGTILTARGTQFAYELYSNYYIDFIQPRSRYLHLNCSI